MVKIYEFESDDTYYGKSAIEKFDKWQLDNDFTKEDFISVTLNEDKIVVAMWV
ncbi:hypothetical protein P9294_gp071 [Bacillus phage FADO]|uniref:Uncharacterized protein n=1 Tax=Bacillus phage FADO TaxID=2917160 RepID=A0AAE9G9N6_9CAUD|nr:hypothetical protein P9294_gp071 [Bacillus phage FADO]UNY48786.1 hypothetical protein fado_71 [Bacillus phage FADO]